MMTFLYKFRTMPIGTKEIASDKIEILNLKLISRILRRTNLDELPQLLNVIKVDFRFIGPRPEIQEYVDRNTFSFLKKR